jgi:uncharacterized cupredoxin-like copper-binding protein
VKLSLAALVLIGGVLTLSASACNDKASADATVGIHYSRFQPVLITATAGEPITVTLRNDDPIAHEWLVGDAAMHERHRTGTEPFHDQIPTEVTIPSFSERVTTVVFDEPGDYAYICHLPGHEAYGMVGTLRVLPP